MLYEKVGNGAVRCHICQWRCKIMPGKSGVCRMRKNVEGVLYVLNYAQVSSVAIDPIEKKPLFHFYPGTTVYSLGTWGCNFHCRHCQNWQISFGTEEDISEASRELPAQRAIDLTAAHRCAGIAWTYNEPAIWFEYTLDCAKLAKPKRLYTVYVTNGFITPEALDTIGPYLDAYRVDIKGFSDEFYRKIAKVSLWKGILEVAIRAKKKWDMHIEVVTNIIPTLNDSESELESIACWIRDSLGELTPWHVTRFYPHHMMSDLPPTPIKTLENAAEIGKRVGLQFIYIGNVPGHRGENTVCYSCGTAVVRRWGYQTEMKKLSGSRCANCGAELNFRSYFYNRNIQAGS